MANVAIFDIGTSAVLDYRTSVNTSDYSGRLDVLINPDTAAVAGFAATASLPPATLARL